MTYTQSVILAASLLSVDAAERVVLDTDPHDISGTATYGAGRGANPLQDTSVGTWIEVDKPWTPKTFSIATRRPPVGEVDLDSLIFNLSVFSKQPSAANHTNPDINEFTLTANSAVVKLGFDADTFTWTFYDPYLTPIPAGKVYISISQDTTGLSAMFGIAESYASSPEFFGHGGSYGDSTSLSTIERTKAHGVPAMRFSVETKDDAKLTYRVITEDKNAFISLSFPAGPSPRVLQSTDSLGGDWINVEGIPAASEGSEIKIELPIDPSVPAKFYRVVEE